METIEFFKGLEDSIKKKEIIDKIVECYEESYKSDYERYSHSMYEKIVKTMFDKKVMGRYNVRERFNFELYCFNEWKNSILNYNINNIHQDYQQAHLYASSILLSDRRLLDISRHLA